MFDRHTRITEDFFADAEGEGLSQPQREALIDLLIWTMYVDNTIRVEENAQLDKVLRSLKWENPLQPQQYLGMAYSRIRRALDTEDEHQRLLQQIAERLGDGAMRRKAWTFARDLAQVDGELSDEEAAFLGGIGRALGIREGD